jgi:hypothetical protein
VTDGVGMIDTADGVSALASRVRASRSRALPACLCIAVYLLLGFASNLPAWLHDPGSWMTCGGCGDNGQEIWFLQWSTFALTHLQDPLRTNWIDYPWGADLAISTPMPLVGMVTTPITLLFGPVFTYNLVNVLAYAASATAAMFACRRWIRSWPASFIGGLLYGFSPYMVGQGSGHLFVLLTFVPPLLLLVLHDILIRRAWSWRRGGVLLAVLLLIQLGLSEEILAEEALVTAIGLAILWLARPAELRAGWGHIWRSLALGIGLALPFIVAVGVISLTGPEHAEGPVHPVSLLAGISSDLLSPFIPTTNQHFTLGAAGYGSKLVALTATGAPPSPDTTENGAYIGIPLLLLLVLGTWRLRRAALVRFAWLMALVSFLFSMGSRLHIGGHDTVLPLPFWILAHLPLLKSEAAARYTLIMWLFLAILAALVVNRWLVGPSPEGATGGPQRFGVRRIAGPALLALSLVSLVPQWPYPIAVDSLPPWFASGAVKQIPLGSPLVTYPYASDIDNLPMFWQAVNGMRYRIPIGQIALPKPHYTPFEMAFNACWTQPTLSMPSRSLIPASQVILRYWQVRRVVVPLQYTINPWCAIRFLTATLRSPPQWQHQAAVWSLPGGPFPRLG